LLILLLCWLYVGLFIVAHDCMHESFWPRKPMMNRVVGQLCLLLYAGFDYDELKRKHHLHHRYSGTDEDPDFDSRTPHTAWRWYRRFFGEYFSARPVLWMTGVGMMYYFVFSAPYVNLLSFWALPAILSSAQLFYFGTFQPHRPEGEPFADRHRAHSSGYGWWTSLLTCFHFGHHHAHHKYPCVPWWGLHTLAASTTSSATSARPARSGLLLSATLPIE
jgi:beta-carotene ketolase (CrtW type)